VTISAAVAAFYVAALVFAIVQIHRTADLVHAERTIWTVAVLLAPFVGAIVWYLAGPHPFGLRWGREYR